MISLCLKLFIPLFCILLLVDIHIYIASYRIPNCSSHDSRVPLGCRDLNWATGDIRSPQFDHALNTAVTGLKAQLCVFITLVTYNII